MPTEMFGNSTYQRANNKCADQTVRMRRLVCTSVDPMQQNQVVFAMSLCASVYMCFVVTCLERADLLALVCGVYCESVTFPLVSCVRCGT